MLPFIYGTALWSKNCKKTIINEYLVVTIYLKRLKSIFFFWTWGCLELLRFVIGNDVVSLENLFCILTYFNVQQYCFSWKFFHNLFYKKENSSLLPPTNFTILLISCCIACVLTYQHCRWNHSFCNLAYFFQGIWYCSFFTGAPFCEVVADAI